MKNKKIIKISTIVILVIILIAIIVLIVIKSNKTNNSDNKTEQNSEFLNEKYTGILNCSKEIPVEGGYYKIFEIQEIKTTEGIAQEKNSLFKVVYNDKDNYEGFKTHEKLENPIYDDENMTIIYDNVGKVDLTKDENGNDVKMEIETILSDLEKDSFVCEKS